MADLLDGIAQYLHQRGIVTYDPTVASGNCFLESMPSAPDVVTVLTLYDDGVEPDSLLPYDEPRLQVRVRGTRNPRISRALCSRIRSELHGLGPVVLPDGTEVILAVALSGAPGSLGVDSSQRHEHVANFRIEIVSRTTHRS